MSSTEAPLGDLKRKRDGVQQATHAEGVVKRYVSKRERAAMQAASCQRSQPNPSGEMLASAGMDHLVHVWSPWSPPGRQLARSLTCHTGAVKDLAWLPDGRSILSASFDCTAKLTDVETGVSTGTYPHEGHVTAVRPRLGDDNVFATGGAQGGVRLWDIRAAAAVAHYATVPGGILDVSFQPDGATLVTSAHSRHKSDMDRALMVWCCASGLPLSGQIYLEGYTCPAVVHHPTAPAFVAQSNAGYAALFAARRPFKLNKRRRFEGHQVGGHKVQADFGRDGDIFASGSADGRVVFYGYGSGNVLQELQAHAPGSVCADVAYHPVLSSTVATSVEALRLGSRPSALGGYRG
eukprot:jgi/Mesen1/8207/ME000442S07485